MPIEDLSVADLKIEARQAAPGAAIRLSWTGKSSAREPQQTLDPYFAGVLATAAQLAVPVEMSFVQCKYVNSSTVPPLIRLIQEARARGVKLVMECDGSVRWQKLLLDSLRVFAKDDGLFELRIA